MTLAAPTQAGGDSGGVKGPVSPRTSGWLVLSRGASDRMGWLRALLLAALFHSLLFSAPLWMNSRTYPLLPVTNWFPILPAPWDKWFFIALLVSLVVAYRFFRPATLAFLAGSLFLALGDQSRWQPWFYLYWVMLLLSLLPEPAALAGCRLALSAVYFWAGVHKCNVMFFQEVVPFFLEPAARSLPAGAAPLVKLAISITPIIETFIGVGLWIPRCRRVAIGLVLAVHITALLTIGPWGQQFNVVVWPWNLVMVALVLILFPRRYARGAWASLRPTVWGGAVVACFWFLPVLTYFGWWDSYLSFSIYSGNTARANIFVSAAMKDRLPASMQSFIHPAGQPPDSGPLIFDFRNWAESEIKVPPPPEPRCYRSVARYVARFASKPDDVRLLVVPKSGPTVFYRATDLGWLPPRP